MKHTDLFNAEELHYIYEIRPELKPIKVPSMSEANLLNQPSVDQIILYFLQRYEVYVEPRSVGSWNGWDTLSTVSSLFAGRGSMSHIASTIFYANRSNQVNSAAQDWGTWKRWALDHPDFNEFQIQVIESINIHNFDAIKDIEEKIKKAELQNKNILKKLKDPKLKSQVDNFIKLNKKKKLFKFLKLLLFFTGPIFLIFLIAYSTDNINKPGTYNPYYDFNENPTEKDINIAKKNIVLAEQLISESGYNYRTYNDLKVLYRKAVNRDPNNKDARYGLGLILYKMDQSCGTARWHLEQITPKDPQFKNAKALLNKINCNGSFYLNYYLSPSP